ncbi:Solute carrier organic anion transporter family member 4C1 [Portunus trituberculatus]|uniref:Solute carrier organic anion transporter family member 4C1 n=1 Tax=Portunus trituberculatus TaxID=210409 RepID=A0A5B7D0Z5_PORTR|nr:Solute carrier organic anion transporter family member 4C1 [Portunus trituberculatus]
MLVYCLVGLTQGMFFTYSVSVISTIEKRFKLKSKETGIILAGNDISQVLLAIFLSYYGTFGHRPRWLAVGALFTAASCFTASLPHFFYGAGTGAEAVLAAVSASNETGSKCECLASILKFFAVLPRLFSKTTELINCRGFHECFAS